MHALASLVFALAGIHIGTDRIMSVGYAPAWSPSGERIAYVAGGDLWVADADGTHQARDARLSILHGPLDEAVEIARADRA